MLLYLPTNIKMRRKEVMRAVPKNINSICDWTFSLFGTKMGGRTNPNATPS